MFTDDESTHRKVRSMNPLVHDRPASNSEPVSRGGCWLASMLLSSAVLLGMPLIAPSADDAGAFAPAVRLANPESKDQDDFCIWVHPQEPARSTVIASDKSAGRVFVYDLHGELLQTIAAAKPGNIDIRQGVKLDGRTIDVVAVNQRDGFKLLVFRVDPQSRKLERLDDGSCLTDPNYGGCLYHSPRTGRLYFICTAESGRIGQYELAGDGKGGIAAKKVRTITIGKCEGAVVDDRAGILYIGEEKKGVWSFGAEPDDSAEGSLIAKVGEHGLKGDVEGLALVGTSGAEGYLLVSDQGRSRVAVYQREAPHAWVGEFSIGEAFDTDGIDVCTANLGPAFPGGIFACHTDRSPRPVLLTPWPAIAASLAKGLKRQGVSR
jgi:myo-inositol-hexaphosphate 3-phosphohydrolase